MDEKKMREAWKDYKLYMATISRRGVRISYSEFRERYRRAKKWKESAL
jgi:hypothetical protein